MIIRIIKTGVLLFLCSFWVSVHAQLPSLDNGYGQKVYQYSDSGKVETYVKDAREKGVRDKREYYYYKAGKINSVQGYVTGKVLNGPYRVYLSEGRLVEKGSFDHGLKDGNWVRWNILGKIILVENYNKGRRSGPEIHYNAGGKKIFEANYINDRKDGEEYAYDSSGNVIKNTLYVRGKVILPGPGLKERFKWLHKRDSTKSNPPDTLKNKKSKKQIK